ncbi:MAG TPA: response regulator [Candidatus Paceibacterota bacterium]|nr:response regulator [Verrucomicrobiota bacterium]HOX02905.1 response regulator [Verrucomicrobiota bacterium]HRZ45657.1 response regulator [Candidatus Paceibacterota bacterium]HRZ93210.1 response regulator [Candidatus Paceibacterota bacterium]
MDKPVILIIEDDPLQREIYDEALSDYDLDHAGSVTEALDRIRRRPPQLIILDHILEKGERGLDYLPSFKDLLPFVPILVVSGALEVHQQIQALQGPRRAHYCIPKPLDLHQLQRTVRIALSECGEAEVVRRFEALERAKRIDADALLSRSADRLSRQNEMLALLQHSQGRPNVSALSRHFRVARRTIIRDLRELIRRGQIPPEVFPDWDGLDNDASDDPGSPPD